MAGLIALSGFELTACATQATGDRGDRPSAGFEGGATEARDAATPPLDGASVAAAHLDAAGSPADASSNVAAPDAVSTSGRNDDEDAEHEAEDAEHHAGGVSDASVAPPEPDDGTGMLTLDCNQVAQQLPAAGPLRSFDVAPFAAGWLVAGVVEDDGELDVVTRFYESDAADRVADEHRAVNVPFDLSASFDPRALVSAGGGVFVADATRVFGVSVDESLELTEDSAFDVALPLIDPAVLALASESVVVGLDVFQGCGLFVRAAVIDPDASGEPEPTMSECLSNFSGALSPPARDGDGVRLLVGERLMFVDDAGAFSEWELQGSKHRWQHRAILAWQQEEGWVVSTEPDGPTHIERIDAQGVRLDGVEFSEALSAAGLSPDGVVPLAFAEPDVMAEDGELPSEFFWLGFAPSGAEGRGNVFIASVALTADSLQLGVPQVLGETASTPLDTRLFIDSDGMRAWFREEDAASVHSIGIECAE